MPWKRATNCANAPLREPDHNAKLAPAPASVGAISAAAIVPLMADEMDFNAINRALIADFRANDGVVGGDFAGWPLVLVTTTGAKSGQERIAPLVYTNDGDDIVIIASKGGAPTSPDWYHNIVKTSAVKVELPGDTFTATATVHSYGSERDRLFKAQADVMPNFYEYEKATTRTIPVVTLKRNA